MRSFPIFASAVAIALFSACERKPDSSKAASLNPASAKTFDAAAEHLDAGGDFYFYVRTEEILDRVPSFLDEWKTAFVALASKEGGPSDQIEAWYAVGRKALLDTGLTQIRAFGVSGLQLEPGLSRTRSVLLFDEAAKSGALWKLTGNRPPHPLDALDMLPATTVYTAFSDFDAAALYAYVMEIFESLPDAAIRAQAQQLPAMAEMMLGMPPAEFFASLGSEIGFVVTADESSTMTIPAGSAPMELPKMAVAILFRVTDDKLYDLLTTKIDETIGRMLKPTKSDENGVRSTTIPVPVQGLPIAPTIARFGDYTVIATSPEIVTALARKISPPPLLKDTPAFKRFASLEKMEGNGFGYLSETGSAILRKFQMNSLDAEGDVPVEFRQNIEKLYELFSQRFVFSIARNGKDSATSVMYSPNGSQQMVAAVAVVPAAVVAAVAMPGIAALKAQAELQEDGTAPLSTDDSDEEESVEP